MESLPRLRRLTERFFGGFQRGSYGFIGFFLGFSMVLYLDLPLVHKILYHLKSARFKKRCSNEAPNSGSKKKMLVWFSDLKPKWP